MKSILNLISIDCGELSVLAQTLPYAAAGIMLVLFVVGSRQVSMLSTVQSFS